MRYRHLVALGFALFAGASQANLLVNGSFEDGTLTPRSDGFMLLNPGDTALTGWTIGNSDVDWGENGNPYGISAFDGERLLDLTGLSNASPYGAISQSIATLVGTRYVLDFYLGTQQDGSALQGPISVMASAGTTSDTFTHDPSGSGNQWALFGLEFVATTTTTLISLQGLSGIAYIGLDDISVVAVPSVPEPATLLLLGAGLLGIGAGRRARPE